MLPIVRKQKNPISFRHSLLRFLFPVIQKQTILGLQFDGETCH